ncbi:MAG TPA: TonB-dependent receptor [Acidobacteriaceae bacterium]|nr:TonB-dependent receptor [Acidobacteriaceae bacterium]
MNSARTWACVLTGVFLAAPLISAQQAQARQQPKPATLPEVRTTVVVVGAPDPISEEDSARSTASLDVQPNKLAYSDAVDLLRDDSSVDLEQRGGGGVQTDVTIRGGSFEQTLVLLNGLRINDAETSHFNLDLPVPIEALSSVNVLHGAGSALYGSDAVSGVVDFITAPPVPGAHLRLRAGGGSFGETEQAAVASWGGTKTSEVLAAGREFSSGFMADRDYRSEEVSSETRAHSSLGHTDLLLAGSDRAFGAAGFYGNYNSWERTKGWFASATQQLNEKTQAALVFRRHSDIFLLERAQPLGYKNQHVDTSWQGVVRRRDDLPLRGAGLFYGVEINADQIHSTNLGDHGRNRGAGYLDFELLGRHRGTLSLGAREELLSGGLHVFTPSAAASVRLPHAVKLRASVGRGFRIPTYTDLYYSDPSTRGNPNLKPESAWSFDGGADWYASAKLAASLTVFHSSQTNAIDYVRADPAGQWQAENLTGLRFTGVEAALDWRPQSSEEVRLALTTLSGAKDALGSLQSEYVFNYPVQNASAEWVGRWKNGLLLRQRVRVVNRLQRSVYPVWDASAAYEAWRVKPYVRATNLSNTAYQEIVGVPMPGRAFVAGVECVLGRRD